MDSRRGELKTGQKNGDNKWYLYYFSKFIKIIEENGDNKMLSIPLFFTLVNKCVDKIAPYVQLHTIKRRS